MSTAIDITLDQFLSEVNKSNTKPNGQPKDPRLLERFQNPVCQECQAHYKEKYPGQPFKIKCQGIYDETDYELKRERFIARYPDDEPQTIDEIREIYDLVFWAERNIVVKDDNGNLIPFKARWYQEETLRCTATHKVDRWGRGLGKALSLDTPIPTPTGWTTMENLQPGDPVFDQDGQSCTVTFVTDAMRDRQCYDVVFSDGSVITADAEHLWETWDKPARRAEARKARRTGKLVHTRTVPKPEVRTTEQVLQTLTVGLKGEKNHSVLLAKPLNFTEKELLIEPYVLGAWLGDGHSAGARLTCDDPEIVEHITSLGYEVRKNSAQFIYGIQELIPKLRSLGVLNNKFVPSVYLQASIEQRLELLRGLMDTDGNVREDGWTEFDNTNLQLAQAVRELVHSLGMQTSWSERIPTCTNNGSKGEKSYRVGFFPQPDMNVFRLSRKARRVRKAIRPTVQHRYIVEVRTRPSVPVKCIQVDSPSRLYLAGTACIPTHNTTCGVIEELHKAMNTRNYEILVVCPADSQSEKWYNEILLQIENSPTLRNSLASSKQQPFKVFRFHNGSTIAIFTAGSASGRGANSIRSQSPRRIRLEEQDYLAEKDYEAIDPLINRYTNSEFHGSSTPTGARSKFWEMCTRFPRYREFYYPISVHPDWGPEKEEICIQEAKTTERYRHEYLAEFGDPAQGVFKSIFIDRAKVLYVNPHRPHLKGYTGCEYDPSKRYFLGVDWNGEGTGTRARVVEYDPETRLRRCVDKATVDEEKWTTLTSIAAIKALNQKWHCEKVFIDKGFGQAQDELLRAEGLKANADPDTRRLRDIVPIDFGAKLKTNRLVPQRTTNSKYLPEKKEEELERPTKPFMVEGAVMCFENGLFEFSSEGDELLEEQLRAYRVKSWSSHGYPSSYSVDGDCGDHDLDALMLALLAVEMTYGMFQSVDQLHRLIQIAHVEGFGLSPAPMSPAAEQMPSRLEQKRERTGVPTRLSDRSKNDEYRMLYLMRGGAMVAPRGGGQTSGKNPGTSRTAAFRKTPNNWRFL